MRASTQVLLCIAATLGTCAVGAAGFVVSGTYNIGADDHHTKPVLATIELLRDRSIEIRASAVTVPPAAASSDPLGDAARYAALCAGCHLGPGVSSNGLRAGLYPHPPNLAQADLHDAQRIFWVIKHGIKMSAMPAWGKTLDDPTIWNLVTFVQQLPQLSPEKYQQLTTGRAP